MSNVSFVIFAVLLLAGLASALLYFYLRNRRSAEPGWEDLMKRLNWIDRDAIATIALDAITENGELLPQGDGFVLESGAIWNLLGGLEGLEAVERNCQVLVDLAAYLQRWYPEALVVAEQLRRNAREIEWHVERLRGAAQTGNLQSSFGDYAQRAVVTYYLMTRHLLALYDTVDFANVAQLQQAI